MLYCLRLLKKEEYSLPLQFHLKDTIIDPQGRFVLVICTLDSVLYTLVNVYATNVMPVGFLKRVLTKAVKMRRGNLVIGGDLNTVLNPTLDATSTSQTELLGPLLHKLDLYEVWRCHHTSEKDFTFFSTPHIAYSRIDYLLVDKYMLGKVSRSQIGNITWSDHAPVRITIQTATRFNPQ